MSTNAKNEKSSKAGSRIRTYREHHEWSVYDLAQKSGVDEKTINAIEKGEVMPALGVLVKIAQALGQRLGTFMDDQFKPDPIVTRAADLEAKKVAGEGMNALGYASHSLALGKPDRHIGSPRRLCNHAGKECGEQHPCRPPQEIKFSFLHCRKNSVVVIECLF